MEKDVYVLGIESSCDETSVAVVKNGREVLSNVINSQIRIHENYGGVVPEIASRCHTEVINQVMKQALKEANMKLEDIDVICTTYGPGLVGALLVGVSYAKGLSFAVNKPLLGVNHIEGHIAGNYITHKDLKPPFLCLMMSGGNTQIVYVKDYTEFEVLGKTRDDAIGEAFDKVARVLGLPYPGGPEVSKLAEKGKNSYKLPKTKFDNYDFSFSGIKTAVINLAHKEGEKLRKEDLACSFETTVCEELVDTTISVMNDLKIKKVVLAGGVSANKYLRGLLKERVNANNFEVYMPELKYCTDNAAMIGVAASYNYESGKYFDIKDKLELNAVANLKIDE